MPRLLARQRSVFSLEGPPRPVGEQEVEVIQPALVFGPELRVTQQYPGSVMKPLHFSPSGQSCSIGSQGS